MRSFHVSAAFLLSQQRHTACEFVDFFLRTADGIGFAALCQIAKVNHGQILKVGLIELLADCFDDFR